MSQEDVIRMAREAGFGPAAGWTEFQPPFLRFAALVAAAEREAWLKKLTSADWNPVSIFRHYYPSANGDWVDLRELSEIIRARGTP